MSQKGVVFVNSRTMLIYFILAIAILCSGCSHKNQLIINQEENIQANIESGGWVFKQNDWIYYCNRSDGWSLYKVQEDGTDKMRLDENIGHFILVDSNWIYFNAAPQEFFGEEGVLCMINIDGTSFKVLTPDDAIMIKIVNDWIYYINNVDLDNSKIYRIKKDGTERKQISKENAKGFMISGDWIYYTDVNHGLSKIKLDGTEKMKLGGDVALEFLLVGGNIIYVSEKDENHVYSIDLNGAEKTLLSQESCEGINLYKDWLIFGNKADGGKLYKTQINSKANTKICDDSALSINVIDDWIYYISSMDSNLYRIKVDGTQKEIMD